MNTSASVLVPLSNDVEKVLQTSGIRLRCDDWKQIDVSCHLFLTLDGRRSCNPKTLSKKMSPLLVLSTLVKS